MLSESQLHEATVCDPVTGESRSGHSRGGAWTHGCQVGWGRSWGQASAEGDEIVLE